MYMEEWRVITDFPNYYVSNLGNVKNIKTSKIMKQTIKSGYYHVCLTNETIKKIFKIHRLVALSFINNPENKPEVNHEDKNKLNNNVNNLSWMTRKENNQHKTTNLIYKSNKNKPIYRISTNNIILERYNSIEHAGNWAYVNNYTKTAHNGRNSIGNCVNNLTKTAYGFKWEFICNNIVDEEWKEINFSELCKDKIINKKYYVSNLGRYKNSYGNIMENYKVNDNGYIRVNINNKTFLLHRLIAYTFLPNIKNKNQVNHKDGNKLNNNIENLEFVTNQENQIHKYKLGLSKHFTKKIKQYDLNGELIIEHISTVSAAKKLNISSSTINSVLNNRRKTAGGFIWKYSHNDKINNIETNKITINKNRGKQVCQYDLDMNLIKTHNSINQAFKNTNIHKNNIWCVINNLRKTAGGFIWKYLD